MEAMNRERPLRPICIGMAALDPCPLHEIIFTVSNKYRVVAVAGREDWMAHMALVHVYYTLSRIQEGMDWVIGLGLKGALEHYARVYGRHYELGEHAFRTCKEQRRNRRLRAWRAADLSKMEADIWKWVASGDSELRERKQ